ncbi:MAG: DUF493 family protein [Deltaproteobacteria bacterium]
MSLPPIELLESVHSFPGPYTFKIILRNEDSIQGIVLEQIQKTLNLGSKPQASSRISENAKHLSLTVELNLQTAQQVHLVYRSLEQISGVLLLL